MTGDDRALRGCGRSSFALACRRPAEVKALLLRHREQVEKWRKPDEPESGQKQGVRFTKVQTLFERKGVVVPDSSVHRFAVNHYGFGQSHRLLVRMAESAPGELAEVDFCSLGLVPYILRAVGVGRSGRSWWCLSSAAPSSSSSRRADDRSSHRRP